MHRRLSNVMHLCLICKLALLPPGSLGQQFTRELKKSQEDLEEYKSLVGQEAKKRFRARWLDKKLGEAKSRAVKAVKQSQSEEKVGNYVSFKRVWDLEGSDIAGYKAFRVTGCWRRDHELECFCLS